MRTQPFRDSQFLNGLGHLASLEQGAAQQVVGRKRLRNQLDSLPRKRQGVVEPAEPDVDVGQLHVRHGAVRIDLDLLEQLLLGLLILRQFGEHRAIGVMNKRG